MQDEHYRVIEFNVLNVLFICFIESRITGLLVRGPDNHPLQFEGASKEAAFAQATRWIEQHPTSSYKQAVLRHMRTQRS